MKFEEMKAAMQSSKKTTTVTCPDVGEITLKQLDAKLGMQLATIANSLNANGTSPNDQAMLSFYVTIISKSIIDDDGNAVFDTDDGRETLTSLRFDQLMAIGNACLELNGMAGDEAKKN